MTKPNLFDFATSELSQDAFICWLLAWNRTDFKEAKVAKEFIAFLYNSFMDVAEHDQLWRGDYSHVTHCDIGDFFTDKKHGEMLQQQFFKMDVFFVVQIRGEYVSFIIEDKTNTSAHNHQLSRYVRDALKYKNIPLIRIYYKTGYIYQEDKSACSNACEGACINKRKQKDKNLCKETCKKAPYHIIDAKMILDFLKKNDVEHVIYQDYKTFIETKYVKPQKMAIESLKDNKVTYLNRSYVQYEFMRGLVKACNDDGAPIRHGNSKSKPYTEYTIKRIKSKYGDLSESIFYRIEKQKKGVYALSLRQYAKINKNKEYISSKLGSLKDYSDAFNTALKGSGLNTKAVRKDRSGANSSQIAMLYISDDGNNTITDIYTKLPKVNQLFLMKLECLENK